MLQALRRQINPATILALVALVFAATGGAFAATGGGKSSAKATASSGHKAGDDNSATTATTKKKKKPSTRGPRGPVGPKGATGATGATGAAGANGLAGANGAGGSQGAQGPQGPQGPQGVQGVQGVQGKQGVIHPEETLPSGASETGTWSMTISAAVVGEDGFATGPISFTIPLAKALPESRIKILPEGYGTPGFEGVLDPECPGNAEAATAEPGFLCVYQRSGLRELVPSGEPVLNSVNGVVLTAVSEEIGAAAFGSWAVTAEQE
jgi:hypothetical protein